MNPNQLLTPAEISATVTNILSILSRKTILQAFYYNFDHPQAYQSAFYYDDRLTAANQQHFTSYLDGSASIYNPFLDHKSPIGTRMAQMQRSFLYVGLAKTSRLPLIKQETAALVTALQMAAPTKAWQRITVQQPLTSPAFSIYGCFITDNKQPQLVNFGNGLIMDLLAQFSQLTTNDAHYLYDGIMPSFNNEWLAAAEIKQLYTLISSLAELDTVYEPVAPRQLFAQQYQGPAAIKSNLIQRLTAFYRQQVALWRQSMHDNADRIAQDDLLGADSNLIDLAAFAEQNSKRFFAAASAKMPPANGSDIIGREAAFLPAVLYCDLADLQQSQAGQRWQLQPVTLTEQDQAHLRQAWLKEQ